MQRNRQLEFYSLLLLQHAGAIPTPTFGEADFGEPVGPTCAQLIERGELTHADFIGAQEDIRDACGREFDL